MSEGNLIVGLDLCDDYTQISYFNYKTFEVESIYVDSDEQTEVIPTVLAVDEATKDWYFGQEAIDLCNESKGVLVEHFIAGLSNNEGMTVYDITFQPIGLAERFLRKVLLLLKKKFPNDTVKYLMITVESLDKTLIDGLYEALETLGLGRNRVSIQSHIQSYMYYALSQKKELWMNDTGLFDFNDHGLYYYQLSIDRRNRPMVVGVASKDYSEAITYQMHEEQVESLDYAFENIAKTALHKQIVSTIYLTGKGFEGDWIHSSLDSLCVGRRVFVGRTLYCIGACFAAREMVEQNKLQEFVFISEEMIACNISSPIYYEAKVREIALIGASTPWYDVDYVYELILDNEIEIELTIGDVVKRQSTTHIIALEGLERRETKTTRISLHFKCVDRNTLVVTVKDLGFGDFVPSSNRIWETLITI